MLGVLILLAVAPSNAAMPLLDASSSRPPAEFNACFVRAQDSSGKAWAYLPAGQGGTFTDFRRAWHSGDLLAAGSRDERANPRPPVHRRRGTPVATESPKRWSNADDAAIVTALASFTRHASRHRRRGRDRIAAALSVATLSSPRLAHALDEGISHSIQGVQTVAAMLAERSPGERPEGALANLKPKRQAALHERALPKVRGPAPTAFEALAGPPPIPPLAPPPEAPLYAAVASPPTPHSADGGSVGRTAGPVQYSNAGRRRRRRIHTADRDDHRDARCPADARVSGA